MSYAVFSLLSGNMDRLILIWLLINQTIENNYGCTPKFIILTLILTPMSVLKWLLS